MEGPPRYFGRSLRKGTLLEAMKRVRKFDRPNGTRSAIILDEETKRTEEKLMNSFRRQMLSRIFPGRAVESDEASPTNSKAATRKKKKKKKRTGERGTKMQQVSGETPGYMRPTKSWNAIHGDLVGTHEAPHLKYRDMEGSALNHRKTGRLSPKGSFTNVPHEDTKEPPSSALSRRGRFRQTLKKHAITAAQLWNFCDSNRADRITINQFRSGLERASIYLPPSDLRKLFVACDVDNDGTIEWKEMVLALTTASPKKADRDVKSTRSTRKSPASPSSSTKPLPHYMQPTKKWASRQASIKRRYGRWTEIEEDPFSSSVRVHEHNTHANETEYSKGRGFARWEDSLHDMNGVTMKDKLAFSPRGSMRCRATMASVKAKLRAAAYEGPGGVSLKTLFERFEHESNRTSGSGKISRAAFAHCLRRTVAVDREDIEQIIGVIDSDGDGYVSFVEFLEFVEFSDKATTSDSTEADDKKRKSPRSPLRALQKLRKAISSDSATFFGLKLRDVRSALRKAGGGAATLNVEGILRAFVFLRFELKPHEARRLAVTVSPQRLDGLMRCDDLLRYISRREESKSTTKVARRSEAQALTEYRNLLNEGQSVPLLDSEVRRLWETSEDRRSWLRESAALRGEKDGDDACDDGNAHFMRPTENWTREHGELVGRFEAPHLKYERMNGATPRHEDTDADDVTSRSVDDEEVKERGDDDDPPPPPLPPLPASTRTRRRADHRDWKTASSPKRGSYFGTYAQ
eukprot:g420.t1